MNARLSTALDMLVVRGTLDVRTVWPEGSSDADTLRLHVDPSTEWATFRKNGVVRPVRGLERAVVHGTVIRPVLSTTSAITIRLQGIDAPELHYRAPVSPRVEVADEEPRHAPTYRQPFGESSTAALHDYLSSLGDVLQVEAWTAVDQIGDAFDTYGRFVGDVVILVGDRRIEINHWLVARGLAFPTFYTSMRSEEIGELVRLARRARTAGRGLWARYATEAKPVPPTRLYRGTHAPLREDRGSVSLPKLFRRRVAWRESNLVAGGHRGFRTYLEGRDDRVVLRPNFLAAQRAEAPAATSPFLDVLRGSELVVEPWDLVFEERPSWVRFP